MMPPTDTGPFDSEAEVKRLRAAMQWLVNLAHGMGRAGGPPEEGEWDAAWKNAADCLIGALTKPEGEG